MKALRFILLLAVGAFILYVKVAAPTSSSAPASVQVQAGDHATADESIPPKALQVLQIVRSTGRPPDGYVGGRVFENREGHLPSDGDYREFDVDPHNGGRNAERIIVEWNSKKAWYTADHYQTFTPLP